MLIKITQTLLVLLKLSKSGFFGDLSYATIALPSMFLAIYYGTMMLRLVHYIAISYDRQATVSKERRKIWKDRILIFLFHSIITQIPPLIFLQYRNLELGAKQQNRLKLLSTLLVALSLLACLYLTYTTVILPLSHILEIQKIRNLQILEKKFSKEKIFEFKRNMKIRKMLRMSHNRFTFDLSRKNKIESALFQIKKQEDDCAICYRGHCNAVLENCLHGGLCKRCVKALKAKSQEGDIRCPICRQVSLAHFDSPLAHRRSF